MADPNDSDAPAEEHDAPTKEQRLELVRHRLIPANSIPNLTRTQADKIIRRARWRRRRAAAGKSLLVVIILGFAGAGAYWGWEHRESLKEFFLRESPPSESSTAEKPLPPQSELVRYHLSFGDWEPWIGSHEVVLVSSLPPATEALLKKQNRLFHDVLAARDAQIEPSFSKEFEEIQSRFPEGEGINPDFRNRYKALLRTVQIESILPAVQSVRSRLERDVQRLKARGTGDNGPSNAQAAATLGWLDVDLRAYLDSLQQFAKTVDKNDPLQAWNGFEQSQKPLIERAVEGATAARLPVESGTVNAPRSSVLLLRAQVGSRQIIFLPEADGPIRFEPSF